MDPSAETAKRGDISPARQPQPLSCRQIPYALPPFHPAANPHTKRELPLSWYSSAEKKVPSHLHLTWKCSIS